MGDSNNGDRKEYFPGVPAYNTGHWDERERAWAAREERGRELDREARKADAVKMADEADGTKPTQQQPESLHQIIYEGYYYDPNTKIRLGPVEGMDVSNDEGLVPSDFEQAVANGSPAVAQAVEMVA